MAEAPTRAPQPVVASEIIRDARLRAGLTQVQLAARAGVTQSVISTYENGRREPSLAALQRLVRAAGFEASVDLLPVDAPLSLLDRVTAVRQALVAAVERNGGAAPRVLCTTGSRRRRESVGLLVDLERGAGIFTLMRIQDEAERLLGVDVEVLDAACAGPEKHHAAVPL
ncbi:XRE family transcriptional regulator [Curtobacterium sp. HSID17257]|uniref:XRE family transcriptional regulator n=1 Tax=Curtobacterium sp. HSID17257 TaxID=2419510 RepID=UPI0013868FDB|nr:XRE family transcriptional regulator [Curtobacterium sp. HSID17257]